MCGIVGLYLKDRAFEDRLGSLFTPMLIEMTARGPDSAGLAIYRDQAPSGSTKITAFHPNEDFDWDGLAVLLRDQLAADFDVQDNSSHAVITTKAAPEDAVAAIEAHDPNLQVMSYGDSIEIYKEMGLPRDVAKRFGVETMSGSHIIGHTRMATESAVTTAGSHPFSTGADLCLVHNGSLSNHNRLRDYLRTHKGMQFRTENDTEVGAAYISSRLQEGRTLHEAFEDGLDALDGFYTFVAGTRTGFAVLRDPIACKPAVLAETDDYVAFASEYHALAELPGIEQANVWEPEPATVYSWGGTA
ncbi:MAG: class II glutamine amidotransferase [Geminicoccaceae bacterium]